MNLVFKIKDQKTEARASVSTLIQGTREIVNTSKIAYYAPHYGAHALVKEYIQN